MASVNSRFSYLVAKLHKWLGIEEYRHSRPSFDKLSVSQPASQSASWAGESVKRSIFSHFLAPLSAYPACVNSVSAPFAWSAKNVAISSSLGTLTATRTPLGFGPAK